MIIRQCGDCQKALRPVGGEFQPGSGPFVAVATWCLLGRVLAAPAGGSALQLVRRGGRELRGECRRESVVAGGCARGRRRAGRIQNETTGGEIAGRRRCAAHPPHSRVVKRLGRASAVTRRNAGGAAVAAHGVSLLRSAA